MLYNNNSSFSINPFTLHWLSIYPYPYFITAMSSLLEKTFIHLYCEVRALPKRTRTSVLGIHQESFRPNSIFDRDQIFLSATLIAPIRITNLVPQSVGMIVRVERVHPNMPWIYLFSPRCPNHVGATLKDTDTLAIFFSRR